MKIQTILAVALAASATFAQEIAPAAPAASAPATVTSATAMSPAIPSEVAANDNADLMVKVDESFVVRNEKRIPIGIGAGQIQ